MKAPEKLYLRKRNKLPLEVVIDKWYDKDPQSLYGSIEYTRTDVIVDRALKWMETFLNTHYVMRYSDSCEPIHDAILVGFGEYMKGEKA